MRLMGLPTRETNSCQASSSEGPPDGAAHKQTTSVRDRDEYRVGLAELHILV